jgi:hypothetical protein
MDLGTAPCGPDISCRVPASFPSSLYTLTVAHGARNRVFFREHERTLALFGVCVFQGCNSISWPIEARKGSDVHSRANYHSSPRMCVEVFRRQAHLRLDATGSRRGGREPQAGRRARSQPQSRLSPGGSEARLDAAVTTLEPQGSTIRSC